MLSEITDAAQAHRAAQEARQAAEDEGFAEADPGEVFARQMQRRMFPLFLRAMVAWQTKQGRLRSLTRFCFPFSDLKGICG